MALPLKPPVKPQLARTAKELPEGDGWAFEPKWDGFRTVVFRDGDDVHLQSRNGKPMNRYFPEVAEQVAALPGDRLVIDGEMIVVVDGVQEFDLLGQPYLERRRRLEAVVEEPVRLTPMTADARSARQWLTGVSEGVIAKEAEARYEPGERTGMLKIKRVRTADLVVQAFRFGKKEGEVGSLILGAYDDAGQLHVVGHTSGFKAKEKRELIDKLEPYRTYEQGAGEPSRWKSDEELVWEGLRPELVVEVGFDHITGDRIRHGAKFKRWRDDKDPRECRME